MAEFWNLTGTPRTREVKMAVAFTQAATDEDGRPVRDLAFSSYVATFPPAAVFGTLMAAEARRRGAAHIRQMVILGAGAAWIWNLATAHFCEATKIVDLYHAREHLHDLAKFLEFMLGGGKDAWLAARWPSWTPGTSRPSAPSRWPTRKPWISRRPWATSNASPCP